MPSLTSLYLFNHVARTITTGIDIGTYQIKVVVVEEVIDKRAGARQLRILGTGLVESKGLRHGYIVNKEEVTANIIKAKRQAEASAHVPIRAGFLAVGGISLDEARATGSAIISRADQEITRLDLEKAGKLKSTKAVIGNSVTKCYFLVK